MKITIEIILSYNVFGESSWIFVFIFQPNIVVKNSLKTKKYDYFTGMENSHYDLIYTFESFIFIKKISNIMLACIDPVYFIINELSHLFYSQLFIFIIFSDLH